LRHFFLVFVLCTPWCHFGFVNLVFVNSRGITALCGLHENIVNFYGAVHLNTTNFVQTVSHLQIKPEFFSYSRNAPLTKGNKTSRGIFIWIKIE